MLHNNNSTTIIQFLCLSEELDIAGVTVRVLTVLLEGALVEQLEAKGTVEVLWVPLLAHSSDALAYYREKER